MSELRKQFEALAYRNKWDICRYPQSNYHNKEGHYCDEFVDGAWWAFQEQNKRIDRLKKYLIDSCAFEDGYIEEILK